ncbi:MAG: tetratricopeptide repeat protein [Candidatus Obscuribacterales bacterium]|nr:tetratricopeptide repeat protein [Candidatus Obscuribacterales bacterium]
MPANHKRNVSILALSLAFTIAGNQLGFAEEPKTTSAQQTDEAADSIAVEPTNEERDSASSRQAEEVDLARRALIYIESHHNEAIRHWELSRRYFRKWDLDLCETELDLAVLYWDTMQIAHRNLCLVTLLRLNLPKSIAEFAMTVGLGEPIPRTDAEGKELIQQATIKHYKEGLKYARSKDWQDAAFELELAARLVPDDFAVQRSLAFAYANLGNLAKAIEHYQKTFALAPADGSSRADLAYFLAENGKTEEAFKQMEEAVKSSPQAACYHVDLSWMAESRGDLETASKEMHAAIDLAPKQAGLWAHLGEVLEQKGDTKQAADAYHQALTIDPQLANAKERLSKLEPHHS